MRLAYIQLTLSMCLVGINIAIGKVITQSVPVFLFSDIRFIIALLVLVPMMINQQVTKFKLTGKEWLYLFLQSIFGVFLFSIFMLYGVRHTSAISAGIITSTTPACIALIAFFFLREKLSIIKSISLVLAVSGISLITLHGGDNAVNASGILGNIFILLAVISEALFTILAKPLSTKLTPIQMATAVNSFGFIMFIPFSIREVLTTSLQIGPKTWVLIIYYSLTASVISFILWYRGISKVPANIAGLFTVFMPISSAVIGVLFLHEDLTLTRTMGMILAIAAILIGVRKPKIEPLQHT